MLQITRKQLQGNYTTGRVHIWEKPKTGLFLDLWNKKDKMEYTSLNFNLINTEHP